MFKGRIYGSAFVLGCITGVPIKSECMLLVTLTLIAS